MVGTRQYCHRYLIFGALTESQEHVVDTILDRFKRLCAHGAATNTTANANLAIEWRFRLERIPV